MAFSARGSGLRNLSHATQETQNFIQGKLSTARGVRPGHNTAPKHPPSAASVPRAPGGGALLAGTALTPAQSIQSWPQEREHTLT